MPPATAQERRKLARVDFQGRVEINPLESFTNGRPLFFRASSLNLSEGGVCVRVEQELAIRSRVAMRILASPRRQPLECHGRVAWVIQRLDLRTDPPFLYDIGVEFINPSVRLRQFASRLGVALKPPVSISTRRKPLEPATIHGRCYVPQLQQEASAPRQWHLVVTVDGVPCVSRRTATRQAALAAWEQFQRRRRR